MRFRVIGFSILIFLLSAVPLFGQNQGRSHRVLILHSYSQDFTWTESINRGLLSVLDSRSYELSFEYIDAKRYSDEDHLNLFTELLRRKYQDRIVDLVLVSDNIAYGLFLEMRDDLFPGIPALAIGLNSPVDRRLENISYIIENNDYRSTLDLALGQFPDAEQLHIILDRTVTGMIIREQIEDYAARNALPRCTG
jgi:hypothetical protein